MLASVYQFLFKYQPLVFEQGDFVWGSSRWMAGLVLAATGAAVYALLTYRNVRGHGARDRAVRRLASATIGPPEADT